MKPLLSIQDLTVSFDTFSGEVHAVNGINFEVFPGEAVGIVGESGCGKSATAHAIMKLIPTPPGRYKNGRILFNGTDLLQKTEKEMTKIRGNTISMIFQDPMTSLNPVLTIGRQITESLELHQQLSKQQAYHRAAELLNLVGIAQPLERLKNYPHQFSGGMRQRVMIAMALACNPQLLLADEPTTALDVTIQAQIIDLLKELQATLQTSIVFISHDLGAVAQLCNRVMVMYAGKIVETATVTDMFHRPAHPYTWGLLQSLPRLDSGEKKRLTVIDGQPPNLLDVPPGCSFHPRCPHAMRICCKEQPKLTVLSPQHAVTCWLQHPDAPKPQQEVSR